MDLMRMVLFLISNEDGPRKELWYELAGLGLVELSVVYWW